MTTVGAIPAAVDLAVYQGDDFGPLTLPAGAAWDCQMTTSAGKIQTLAAGQVKTTADVAR